MNICWCGNSDLHEYSEDYYKCEKCHTLISKNSITGEVYHVVDENVDLYGKNYWESAMANKLGSKTLSEAVDMYLLQRAVYWTKNILKYIKLGSDIAEIGCGLGQLQYILSRIGYNQLAFELSPEICDYMNENLKVNVHKGLFVTIENAYDGILAFDLFEHIVEPVDFAKSVIDSLRPDGIFCLQLPCYDPTLDYENMFMQKPRFGEQLLKEQHVFLYSKESIESILRNQGFNYFVFEHAYFGDDYDMFLFVSKEPITLNSEEDIDNYLNKNENGRLVKALITLFDKYNDIEERYLIADKDRVDRLEQVNILTEMVNSKIEEVNILTEMINSKKK